MFAQLKTSILMLLVFSVLTGLVYPLAITGVAQIAFPQKANGSLIMDGDRAAGSELIGQPFDDPRYFWSRPSATGPFAYNAAASCGSNLAVTNPAQADAVASAEKLRDSGIPIDERIPVDLLTASGSGLDPHISPAAARIQISRIARARAGRLSEEAIGQLVEQRTEGRQFGVLGEPRVNVLMLNLALDAADDGHD